MGFHSGIERIALLAFILGAKLVASINILEANETTLSPSHAPTVVPSEKPTFTTLESAEPTLEPTSGSIGELSYEPSAAPVVQLFLNKPSPQPSLYSPMHNGTINNFVYYGVRTNYDSLNCDERSVVLIEEHVRVDNAVCYRYSGVSVEARSFKLAYSLDSMNRTFIVTSNYKQLGCQTFVGYETLRADSTCYPDTENMGQSFKIVLYKSSTPLHFKSKIKGYVENIYSSKDASCTSPANELNSLSLIIRRAFAPKKCFMQPSGKKVAYKCRKILSEHWDRTTTTSLTVMECDGKDSWDPMSYLDKVYMPPPVCESTANYPGNARMFMKLSPQNTSGEIMSLDGYYQTLECSEPNSSYFFKQLSYLELIWYIRTGSCTLSLLMSLLTITIIFKIGKWTDATKIIFVLAIAQLVYDSSFYLPYQVTEEIGSDKQYIMAVFISHFLTRVFSLITLMISNILAGSISYILILKKPFAIKSKLPVLLAMIVVISLVFPLIVLLAELELIPCSLGVAPGSHDLTNLGILSLFMLGMMQCLSIGINLLSFLIIATMTPDSRNCCKERKASPIAEISNRLRLYPLIQTVTQLPAIFYAYDRLIRNVSDDDIDITDVNLFEFLFAAITPSAGTLFCFVFIKYHPGAYDMFVCMLKGLCLCKRSDGLVSEMWKLKEQDDNAQKEKGEILRILLAQGVPEHDLERVYHHHKHKLLAFDKMKSESPERSEAEMEEIYSRLQSSLKWVLMSDQSRDIEETREVDHSGEQFVERDANGELHLRTFTVWDLKEMDDDVLANMAMAELQFNRQKSGINGHGSEDWQNTVDVVPARMPAQRKKSVLVNHRSIFRSSDPFASGEIHDGHGNMPGYSSSATLTYSQNNPLAPPPPARFFSPGPAPPPPARTPPPERTFAPTFPQARLMVSPNYPTQSAPPPPRPPPPHAMDFHQQL